MRASPLSRRILLTVLGAASLMTLALAGVLAYPEPLYAYHVEKGRLRLYSDRPFDPVQGRAILDDVEKRLGQAPEALRDPASVYRIFVTNAEWRKRLVFLWNYGAAGVNYYPISGSVFIRQADIDANTVLRSDGTAVPSPRTLAYYAGHEIGHSLIGKRIGAVANRKLPAWIREGMADYIGFGGDVDVRALTRALRAGDPDLDPKRSGLYARYRLLVAWLLVDQAWPVDRLLASDMTITEVERRLDAGMPRE